MFAWPLAETLENVVVHGARRNEAFSRTSYAGNFGFVSKSLIGKSA